MKQVFRYLFGSKDRGNKLGGKQVLQLSPTLATSRPWLKCTTMSSRTRHIDLHYHHVRDLVKRYILAVKWISTKDQVADALTKPMDRNVEVLEL